MKPEYGKVIIEEIGQNYGRKILDFAKQEKFKKERGRGYYSDAQFFRNILKGHVHNVRVEKFLLKVYKHYKKENEKHAQEVEAILAAQ
tara:strand:+ start:5783 stop:6046 length:264 start_codon:yes stop_codon:yes gene_type:complete